MLRSSRVRLKVEHVNFLICARLIILITIYLWMDNMNISPLKKTSPLLILALSFLLVSCGGGNNNKSPENNASSGSTSDALAKSVFSTFSLAGKAINSTSKGLIKAKLLSKARYKQTSQPCNGGGETRYDLGDFDTDTGKLPTNITVIFDKCKTTDNNSVSYMNGKAVMKLSFDNSEAPSFSNYTFTIDDGYFIEGKERLDIKNYEIKSSGGNDKVMMQAKGSFKSTSCLDQWVDFKTLDPIEMITSNTCPTAGKMSVTMGQSTTSITYNSDQSIVINSNGNSQKYDNCTDLDKLDDTEICQ